MVIRNQRQYWVTKEQAEKFSKALASSWEGDGEQSESILRRIEKAGMESVLADLRQEIVDYEVWAS